MHLLYHPTTRRIHAASNVTLQAPDGFAVVEVAGDADTYEFPLGDAPRCLYTEAGEIAADPANPVIQSDVLTVAIKAEAYRRIITIIPEWKQRNLTARATELSMKVAAGGSLTAEEQAEWDAGEDIWTKVKVIRTKSDVLEAQVSGMTVKQLATFDLTDDIHWPE